MFFASAVSEGSSVVDCLAALLTPLIAIIAVYIAYQQSLTNRRRLELDLYDRRLRIYEATVEYISAVQASFRPTLNDHWKFRRTTAEVDFLFGSDIKGYLDELFKHGLELHRWAEEYRDGTQEHPPWYDHAKVVEGKREESEWFTKQNEEALRRFKGYLNLTDRPPAWRPWSSD